MRRIRRQARPALLLLLLLSYGRVHAQHTPVEIAVSFAEAGQVPLVTEPDNAGFFIKPFIGRLQVQFVTNGVQSLSGFVETVNETRTREESWPPFSIPGASYDANVGENLHMTSFGLETIRTLISTEWGFRLGFGLGVGYGFGGASANVTDKSNASTENYTSYNTWTGIYLTGFARARLTVYNDGGLDIGLTATARYWGYPSIGPLSTDPDSYNGPDLRSLHEFGYLAGISVGF